MRALLQITMETEDTTERDKAPTVPSWKRSPSPIFAKLPKNKNKKSRKWIKKHMNYIEKQNQRKTHKTKSEIYLEREREVDIENWREKRGLWFARDLDRIKL